MIFSGKMQWACIIDGWALWELHSDLWEKDMKEINIIAHRVDGNSVLKLCINTNVTLNIILPHCINIDLIIKQMKVKITQISNIY